MPILKPTVLAAVLALAAVLSPAGAGSLPRGFDDNPGVVEAVSKAASSGKPVIVYYSEQNCAACRALDGWLVRRDLREAYGVGYHFAVLFADDLTPQERERWQATYAPRGAPSWVVLAPDGSYLCTANGGFVNATTALEMHAVLGRAIASRAQRRAAAAKAAGPDADAKPAGVRPTETRVQVRPCNAAALGV